MQTRPKFSEPHATGAVNPCRRRKGPHGNTGCLGRWSMSLGLSRRPLAVPSTHPPPPPPARCHLLRVY